MPKQTRRTVPFVAVSIVFAKIHHHRHFGLIRWMMSVRPNIISRPAMRMGEATGNRNERDQS